jgi:hypothetical protein
MGGAFYFVRFESSLEPFRERLSEYLRGEVRGERLAKKIAADLEKRGIRVADIQGTNWGWWIWCAIQEKRVMCELAPDPEDRGWLLSCSDQTGFVSRLIGRIADEQVRALADAVDDIMRTDPIFSRVRWCSDWSGGETSERPIRWR